MLIRRALGDQALAIDHIGSTAVPGLAAKPIIDIALTVPDSSVEASYAPALESEGFSLIVREPEWYEHRLFKHIFPATNLHVFSRGCVEVERVKLFRDWLKTNEADRTLYESTKRQLAARNWRFVQEYANAKTDVIAGILKRAAAAKG